VVAALVGARTYVRLRRSVREGETRVLTASDIDAESEEGFVDLVFTIRATSAVPGGAVVIRATGPFRGEETGLEVAVAPEWQEGLISDLVVYRGEVSIRSIGSPSDALVRALARL
jgi:hypothetical protein